MTLVIATETSSGIVLSADSRQTYKNSAGSVRIGSDSARKIFKLTNKVGVGISGRAFLNEEGQPAKDVGYFINKFKISEDLTELSTEEIAKKLCEYLASIFIKREVESVKKQIELTISQQGGKDLKFIDSTTNLIPYTFIDKDGKDVSLTGWVETITMIVAGADKDDVCRAYSITIPQGITIERDTQTCGALWAGQTDVLSRVILGHAPEIGNLNFVQQAMKSDEAQTKAELAKLEYIINWGTITLQDAVDFCILMTQMTGSIQRFSDGTMLAPGGITGVGGEIDIAIITSEKGFVWLRNKKIKAGDCEIDQET